MLALVALLATAGNESTYTAAPKPVKQVVKTQARAKMLSTRPMKLNKKAPGADAFDGVTMYVT